MTVEVLGELEIGSAMPSVQGAIVTAMADLDARVTALAQFRPVPPSLSASVTLCLDMLQNLQLAVSVGITPPSLDAQVAIVLALVATLKLQLDILLDLLNAMKAGVHVYVYTGATSSFGTEMQAELSGGLPGGSGADVALALTFIATASASKLAMQAVFKTTP